MLATLLFLALAASPRSLSLFRSLSFSLFLSLFLSFSDSLSFFLSLSFPLFLSLFLSFSDSLSFFLSLSFPLFLSLFLSFYDSLSFFLSLIFPLFLSLFLSLSFSLSFSLTLSTFRLCRVVDNTLGCDENNLSVLPVGWLILLSLGVALLKLAYNVMGALHGSRAGKFNSCDNLSSSIHIVLVKHSVVCQFEYKN